MSLITVGTMAFDAIETPFGKVDKIVGGSATYVAYAASNFVTPINQISIIGYDFPAEELDEMKKRGVNIDGVEMVSDKKSFFWSGKYHMDMNSRDTLITDLNVLEDFNPIVPDSYQDSEFLMLGNLMPKLQLSVIQQMKVRPKLIVMDTMNFWMDIALEDLNVSGMLRRCQVKTDEKTGRFLKNGQSRKKGLNRSISDASWSDLILKIEYLAVKQGKVVIKINPKYSSQECRNCGHTDKSNRDGEKFICTECGYHEHADIGAAKTIRDRGFKIVRGDSAKLAV
jgi:IS605 OrfB family transposase